MIEWGQVAKFGVFSYKKCYKLFFNKMCDTEKIMK